MNTILMENPKDNSQAADIQKNSRRLQTRIMWIIIAITLSVGTLFSLVTATVYNYFLQKNLIESTDTNLEFLTNYLDSTFGSIFHIVKFAQSNKEITEYLECTDEAAYAKASTTAYDRLYEEYRNNAAGAFIRRIIVGNDYNRYLQIVPATYSSSSNAATYILGLPYFEEALNSPEQDFNPGLVNDELFRRSDNLVLPVLRPIYAQYRGDRKGYLYLQVEDTLFSTALATYTPEPDVFTYLKMGENYYQITENGCVPLEQGLALSKETMIPGSTLSSHSSVHRTNRENSDTEEILVCHQLSELPDTYLIQTLSKQERRLGRQIVILLWIIIVSVMLFMSILITYYLRRSIALPVSKLQKQLSKIADGDFTPEESLETGDELGDIGRGINDMARNIDSLLNQRIETEKEKKDLEYKVLQNQINPHFLYNTLNSIKWMATVQGATGISEMTTSLSRLLRSISKGTTLQIPLSEELELVQDYFKIQNYRYGGTIQLEILCEDDTLLQGQIIKFTLQPLVENAIFHGLEPKGSGRVEIRVCAISSEETNAKDLEITVWDNGVGMGREEIYRVLNENSSSKAEFFKEIGVSNVHKRLRYQYGESYGITVDSVVGEYTAMHVRIPLIPVQNPEDGET